MAGRGRPAKKKPVQCETWGCIKSPRSSFEYVALGGATETKWYCHAHWKKKQRERQRADGINACSYVEGDYECGRPRATNRDSVKRARKDSKKSVRIGFCRLHEGFYLSDRAAAGRIADNQAPRISVDTDTGCWVIPSKINKHGAEARAGTGAACGRSDWLVYRFLWHHFQDPKPDEHGHLTWGHERGKILGHVCPLKSRGECANPLHVIPMTEKENAKQRHDHRVDAYLGITSVIREAGQFPGLVEYAIAHGLDLYPSTGRGLELLHLEQHLLLQYLLAPDNEERLAACIADDEAQDWAAGVAADWLEARVSLRTYATTMAL